MIIKNIFCELKDLNQKQIDKLEELMPYTEFFDFHPHEYLIGFNLEGDAGTWPLNSSARERGTIPYAEMLYLLGAKEEELVPHVHQKEIIAWANGEEIEISVDAKWLPFSHPTWLAISNYRVKPKLTPTQLRIKELKEELVKLKEQDDVERGIDKLMES